MDDVKTLHGKFLTEKPGTYNITSIPARASWEYIYENKDILLRVDQYGVVNAQGNPPNDIVLFKRERSEKASPWLTWIFSPDCGMTPVNNFAFPQSEKPSNQSVIFSPEKAEYFFEYKEFSVKTEIFIPRKGSAAVMKLTVKNNGAGDKRFFITPALNPFISKADMPLWDKAEWYLRTTAHKGDNYAEFVSKKMDSAGIPENRRCVVFQCSGQPYVETVMEEYTGCGTFSSAETFKQGSLRINYDDLQPAGVFIKEETVCGYQPVFACKYDTVIKSGQEKQFTQVLSMQNTLNKGEYNAEEARFTAKYLDAAFSAEEIQLRKKEFDLLFNKIVIKTEDEMFDYYVNGFLPLQMNWVASLDRGWPTGMRGVRDAANDFMGVLFFDERRPKEILQLLLSCQRSDGWFPRQVSAAGRKGRHDLRGYCDGGVFVLELLAEYINKTADIEFLSLELPWLDSDENSDVKSHIIAAFEYYLSPQNIGEHGLCKIYEGDWLDAVNKAGTNGRGESVMVSCQLIMALETWSEILKEIYNDDFTKDITSQWELCAAALRDNVRRQAYNRRGFFNSVFTDGGEWIFSDNDGDGFARVYGPVNYYAILCGAADEQMKNEIWKNIETLKCDSGYRLFYPPFGEKALNNVGRIASGDVAEGLWENGTVYNHGSQCFLARAAAECGRGELLSEVIRYILPYGQKQHPVEKTHSAPYAVVNCYQDLPYFKHCAGMPFLTGTIAMSLRIIYSWMFGIRFKLNKMLIKPCFSSGKINKSIRFTARDKNITIEYCGVNSGAAPRIFLNGKEVYDGGISYADLKDDNIIKVEF